MGNACVAPPTYKIVERAESSTSAGEETLSDDSFISDNSAAWRCVGSADCSEALSHWSVALNPDMSFPLAFGSRSSPHISMPVITDMGAAPNPEHCCKSTSYPHWRRENFQASVSAESLQRLIRWRRLVDATEDYDEVSMQFYIVINELSLYYSDIIKLREGGCPFESAEEIFEYYLLTRAILERWPTDPSQFEQVGLSAQSNILVEILNHGANENVIPIRQCDIEYEGEPLGSCVHELRQAMFPHWIAGRMFAGSAHGRDALRKAEKLGLGKTFAYQAALEELREISEGSMKKLTSKI